MVSAPWPLSTLAQFKEVAVVDGGRGKSERAWNLLTLQNIDFGPKKLLTAAGERWWRAGGPRGPAGWRMGGRPPSARSPAAAAGWVADPERGPLRVTQAKSVLVLGGGAELCPGGSPGRAQGRPGPRLTTQPPR
jgi:hypothetical protein